MSLPILTTTCCQGKWILFMPPPTPVVMRMHYVVLFQEQQSSPGMDSSCDASWSHCNQRQKTHIRDEQICPQCSCFLQGPGRCHTGGKAAHFKVHEQREAVILLSPAQSPTGFFLLLPAHCFMLPLLLPSHLLPHSTLRLPFPNCPSNSAVPDPPSC